MARKRTSKKSKRKTSKKSSKKKSRRQQYREWADGKGKYPVARFYSERLSKEDKRKIERARKKTKESAKRCPPGKIMREGYRRTSYKRRTSTGKRVSVKGAYVKPVCIIDRGKKGKGARVIPPLTEGLLSQFGYHVNVSEEKRMQALEKAIDKYGQQEVIRHLRARLTLMRANPKAHAVMNRDYEKLRKKHYPHRLTYDIVGY
jgi:hypothetical protein